MNINCSLEYCSGENKFSQLVQMAYRVGYQAALINLNSIEDYEGFVKSGFFRNSSSKIPLPITPATIAQYKIPQSPIPLFPKITISVHSPDKLKQELQYWIQRKCIISVDTSNKETMEVAARDGRVDILKCTNPDTQKNITKGIISLIKQNNGALEISLSSLLDSDSSIRVKILRLLYRLFLNAKVSSTNYILGSNFGNPWAIRGPTESIAILNSFFDIPEIFAKKMLQSNPESIVFRYIKRDLGLYCEPGVEIIDEKKAQL